jgi:transcriptional regulator with XRE-family HTH domain
MASLKSTRDACIPGSIDKLKLGGIIFDTRDGYSIPKAQLAESVGVSISTIDQWEIGGASPLLRKLNLVIDLLELDPRETLSAVCCEKATRCVLAALKIELPVDAGLPWPKWSKFEWLEFAKTIKQEREAIKASRRLISLAADLNMGTLTAIERGLFKAGIARARKLSWLFMIEVDHAS